MNRLLSLLMILTLVAFGAVACAPAKDKAGDKAGDNDTATKKPTDDNAKAPADDPAVDDENGDDEDGDDGDDAPALGDPDGGDLDLGDLETDDDDAAVPTP